MNKGIANKGKFVALWYITTGRLGMMSGPLESTIAIVATTPKETAIGTLIKTSAKTAPKIKIMVCMMRPQS
jgi:hypothetical protein